MKPELHTIIVPIFRSKVTLCISDDSDSAISALEDIGFSISMDCPIMGLQGEDTIDSTKHFYILVTKQESLKETLQIFAHELYHLVQSFMEYKGVTFTDGDANETHAYAYDYFFGEFYDKILSYGE